jgi:hypothetical protein
MATSAGRRSAAAALLLLALAGCRKSEDPRLAALRSDPLASAEVPGMPQTALTTRSGGSTFGKPRHAQVHREFSNGSPVTQAVLDRVAAIARDSGWHVLRASNGGYTGEKTIDDTRASLVITSGATDRPDVLILEIAALE